MSDTTAIVLSVKDSDKDQIQRDLRIIIMDENSGVSAATHDILFKLYQKLQ